MTERGICAFCGVYGDINKEHYIAQRFRDLFPVHSTPDYAQRFSTYSPESRRYERDVERKVLSPWNITVRVGAKCCNGGWMSDLDTLAAPVLNEALTATSRIITQSQLAFVAGWAAKVSALHELARYEHDGTVTAITPEDRRHIKRRLRPPLGTGVWIAAGEWRDALPLVDQTTLRMFTKEVGRPPSDQKDTHATTISFGHLVIQLFGSKSATLLKPGSGPFAEHSVRIWPDPPRGGITWPAGKLFTENEVTGLARSVEQSLSGTIAPMGPT